MNVLWHKCQSEVKANRAKAVLLAGLFLFGCCFWIPLLGRVLTPRRAAAAISTSPEQRAERHEIQITDDPQSDPFWTSLWNTLENDPLFQPADLSGELRDPFLAKDAHEPTHVLPAEEAISTVEAKRPVVADSPPPTDAKAANVIVDTERLRLTSTMVSPSRRAAMINGQFVSVGREFRTNGQRYRLTQVESHRVVLSVGEETIELKISRSQLKDVLGPRTSEDPLE